MEKIFINVLNMSLTAAYCAVIVLIIRMCIRRLPKVYSYALWLVVFMRFSVPLSLKSVYSFVRINSRAISADIGLEQMPHITTGLGQIDGTANRLIAMVLPQANAAASANPLQVVLAVGSWIWLIVAGGLLCYGVVSYCILKYRIKDAVHVEGRVYVTERIPTPFVMGIVKLCIYLPQGLSDRERECIVSHEQVHLKRYDYLVKQFAFIVVCFHWFNPMAWVSLVMMCRDMELSCDEQVLRTVRLDGEQRLLYKKEYAATLLSMASGRRIRLSGPLFFDSGNVKSRIQNVLAYKQRGRLVTYVSVILIILAAVGLMGNKIPDTVQPDTEQMEEAYSILKEAGFTYVCQIPEEYWAGIEGIKDGKKAYPIILGTDSVFDNRDGNMATIFATIYCLTEDGLKDIGIYSSGGTAYPLSYDESGIYLNNNHRGNRCIINTKTWELEIAEGVEVVYDSNGDETYYYMSEDEVQDSNEDQFIAFFSQHQDAIVMNFE
ncbi:MAG: M56 family metallopeptidase [Lachnospiraceae bacterium]|nr:M56 family metallopeptidase [Lachnospiraceae bacterium]